ncbi:sugar phosphate isomerase/epimerase [Roseiconus nitratireducens]|uniref:Sugar phosphate isomerase/epimerase n=1 Tax=Roseiconus nitratireducens TaxID=2605748 RepID=A0A5M6DES3_9BACT|nr:sugar phosphate isomerase/epimerase [Roseiconus nitratireducens]KAA5546037.1 sugar phosphate isomerase/epimerase [Roseiconus nitratireducens]
MKRRQFLRTGAALSLALSQSRWLQALDADNRYRKEIGIQLYTLRNEIRDDVAGTLKAVAEAGYQQVEPYGFPGADEMIQAAKDNGMAVHSSHINADAILYPDRQGAPTVDVLLEKANDAGLTHLVVPYLANDLRGSLDQYKQVAERLNAAAESASQAGIQLSYHNHAFEFQPLKDGRCGYDVFMDEFSDKMKFEVDIFWVRVGGHDPAALIRKLRGRVSQLHLKDLDPSVKTPEFGSVPAEAFQELGDGVIDMEPVLAAAADAGVAHCHVEQDQSPHPVKSIQQSMAYLRQL